uniref:BHLH domain-containing protein n=1 Tax=Lactuca sativa TaxID=4236 RepID=A0A9R1UKH5_LACSA|nr:hypothetical protein LSAT_V11C900461030 [Lactuca sativa]
MATDFFLNAGLHFEPQTQMPSWKLMASAPEMNCPPAQSSLGRFNNFESAFSSMVSSPVSNSVAPNDTFAVRELIGKLGSICNGDGEVSPAAMAPAAAAPLNSPPRKFDWPAVDHFGKENQLNLRDSIPLGSGFPSLTADPGFAERAAKFSSFGSRSFNGRTSQSGLNSSNPDLQFRSSVSPLMRNARMPRVYSSPSLKMDGSAMAIRENKNMAETHMANGLGCEYKSNSNEESSVSEQMQIGLRNPDDSNSRKRKAASSKGKAKEIASSVVKEEGSDDSNLKRQKKTEEDTNVETEKNPKLPEPPKDYKDYIHVRARRGQATDSHSLAERVRREKISERMKLLQDLVPGCNKVTGKALMLDEIINYVQSLQGQVEFLSMKLATVNPRQDFDMNSQLCKDVHMSQSHRNLSQQLYPMETSTSEFYQQNPQQVLFVGSTAITQSSVDPLSTSIVHGFNQTFSQFVEFEGDDLNNIVKMGYRDNRDHDQTSEMKIEL